MFQSDNIKVPILGLIENMSYFTRLNCRTKNIISSANKWTETCRKRKINLLGEIPIVESICESGDAGTPIALDESSQVYKAFINLAENVKALLNKK